MANPSSDRAGQTSTSDAAPEGRETFYEKPVWKRFYAFLLGPALVAAAAIGVFTLFSVMTEEGAQPQELVEAMRSGGQHRRWQAAFQLTKFLQPSVREQDAQVLRESDAEYRAKLAAVRLVVPDLLSIWDDAKLADPEVRRFLALAFGYLGDARVLSALQGALTSDDVELVHYALAAMASTLESSGARAEAGHVDAVVKASHRPEAELRATAVYVLGIVGAESATQRLQEALSDTAPAVRWNAAFGLARQGSPLGADVIGEILDRGPLYEAVGPDPARQRDLFLNALRSAGKVRTPMLEGRLSRIAENEADLRARDLAKRLLQETHAEGN